MVEVHLWQLDKCSAVNLFFHRVPLTSPLLRRHLRYPSWFVMAMAAGLHFRPQLRNPMGRRRMKARQAHGHEAANSPVCRMCSMAGKGLTTCRTELPIISRATRTSRDIESLKASG